VSLTPIPTGSDIQVNTTTADGQRFSAVAALNDGGFVVTWLSFGQDGSGGGIYGQRYDASGVANGTEFRVNSVTTSSQFYSSVTALNDGGFVVTWSSIDQDGSGWGIYGQRYEASGGAAGPEFRINTFATGDQVHSSVTALNDGGFVVTWSSFSQDGSGFGIYGQRYDASGGAAGPEFRINTFATGDQVHSSVTALNDGGFVVTWSGQDGSSSGIYGQRYDASGVANGTEFRVNSVTTSSQQLSSVTALNDGGFVVTWSSFGQDGSSYGIYGQRYDANGAPAGAEFQVNTFTSADQVWSSVAALNDGGFVVTWSSLGQDGSGYGIYGQRYDASGGAAGPEFQINQITVGDQVAQTFYGSETVAQLADGRLVQTWTGFGAEEVFVRLIDVPAANTAPAVTSNGGADTAAVMVAENTAAVTTVTAEDTDVGQALTYSFVPAASGGGADAALFAIDAGTGALSFAAAPNFEAPADADGDGVYEVTVQVSDGNGGTDTQAISVTVTDVNEAPIITSSPDLGSVQEDGTATLSCTLTATDQDAGAQLFWSLVGGSVSLGTDYDFAMDSLTVVRNGTVIFEDTFSDGASPPSVPAGSVAPAYSMVGSLTEAGDKLILTENGAVPLFGAGTPDPIVGQIATLQTDIDPANLTAGLKSTDNFRIEGRFDLVIPDSPREAYGIRLSDRLVDGSGIPPNQVGDDIIELVVVRTVLGDVRVQLMERDPAADTTTILASQVISPPADADQIILRLGHVASSPGVVTASFTYLSGGTVLSTHGAGTGQIFGTEPDGPGNTSGDESWTRPEIISYAPQLTDSTLVGTYGTLGIKQSGEWAYTLANEHANVQALAAGETVTDEFLARVGDGAGGVDTETVSVTVTGSNDAPTDIVLSANAVAENAAAGAVVGNLSALDVDNGASATFSLVDNPGGLFAIANGNQLVVAAGAVLDFEQAQSHLVTVRADDGLGGTFDEVLTIALTDVFENAAPQITSNGGGTTAAVSVLENTTAVTTVAATDPDAGQALTYSIAGGADAGRFRIDPDTGALSFRFAPNFEAPADAGGDNVYDVTVEASDGDSSDTQAIAVAVTDVDDTTPRLLSLVAADASPTAAAAVQYTATFSETVTGVDTSQFALMATGVSGAAVTSVEAVAGSNGTQYTVTVSTGTGDGSIALRFTGPGVRDVAGNALPGGTFSSPAVYSVGAGPTAIAIADVNSDGNLDILTSNVNNNNISILLGDGSGGFGFRTDLFAGPIPVGLHVTDVSGDGLADRVYVNRDSGSLTVRFGNGDGTFQQAAAYAVGNSSNSNAVSVADLNGDGAADLMVAGSSANGVSVLLNNGNGTFQPRTDYATGSVPLDVAHADVNGDGAADIVVANQGADSASVLLGNGDGTFQSRVDYSVGAGSGPLGLDVADVTGDSIPDLVVAATGHNALTVLVGYGDGTFQAGTEYGTGSLPFRVSLADVDGDGDLDALINEYVANDAAVLLNDGTGAFTTRVPYAIGSLGPYEVVTGDVNEDGRPDFIVADADGDAISVLLNQVVPVTGPTYVIDKNDAPTDIVLAGAAVAENATNGTLIGLLTATDPDTGDTLTFSLLDNAGGRFAIADGNRLVVADGTLLDFEAAASHPVTVRVTDGGGLFYDEAVTIALQNVTGTSQTGNGSGNLLTGGGEEDTLSGLGGNDTLRGLGGNDTLDGGEGNDRIDGGDGVDTIFGGAGADTLNGQDGVDTIFGGAGNDVLTGGAGNDALRGEDGDDHVNGGDGLDVVYGGIGNDALFGAAGDDTLYGEDGNDRVDGGSGVDTIEGGAGADTLNGQDGNDTIWGGAGNDVITGGTGNDGLVGDAGDDRIDGGVGDDQLIGADGDDRLLGGDGSDRLNGGAGDDTLIGGAGFDTFVFKPGFGNDRVTGFDADPAGGQDVLELAEFGINAGNFSARVAITDVGADTLITIDGDANQTVRLTGIGNATSITIDDFHFL